VSNSSTPGTEKQRLLVIGDGASATGFSRVLSSIIPHLTGKYEVHHFALSYTGPMFQPESGYTVYPNVVRGDGFGVEQLPPLVKKIRPHLALILNDPWFMPFHHTLFSTQDPPVPVVLYTAIDNEVQDAYNFEDLGYAGRIVVFTDFAKQVISDLSAKYPSLYFPPLEVIPHGIDTGRFHMLVPGDRGKSREAARDVLFYDRPWLRNQFIVLNANKNQERKRIDITMEGFAKFARGKSDVKLYLHMGMQMMYYDVKALIEKFSLAGKVILTSEEPTHPDVSDHELNILYNACDVGLNTAGAEGWGLVSFEHAATGVAQIVPGHTACTGIWQDAALLLETECESSPQQQYKVRPESVHRSLDRLYRDSRLLTLVGDACYTRVTSAQYRWENIAARFSAVFDELSLVRTAAVASAP
jgi:glycosyltransferase involved in cell wall biosynthesis